MADPKDTGGAGGGPGSPPAIPRLTPAVPEQVDPATSTPRAPIAGTGVRPPAAGAPPSPSRTPVPPTVAPMVPSVPPVAPLVRPAPRTPTGSVPAVAPVAGRTPTGSIPAIPPVARTPTRGGITPVPAVPPIAFARPAPAASAAPPADAGTLGALERAELERRALTLDQLDYFQVMGLDVGALPADIKLAFHHQSRTYHPDRFFQSTDVELRDQVNAVYKRVTEAYFVLRDDARRKQYLADITGPDRQTKLRFDEAAEAEAKAAVKKEFAEQIGTHPKGRQFFGAGVADLEAGRLSAAERNIKLALTYEPTNALYKQKLEEAQAKLYEEYKRSGKGFRIE